MRFTAQIRPNSVTKARDQKDLLPPSRSTAHFQTAPHPVLKAAGIGLGLRRTLLFPVDPTALAPPGVRSGRTGSPESASRPVGPLPPPDGWSSVRRPGSWLHARGRALRAAHAPS